MYRTNPAALILPIVERIAPDRLADVFWRAVALHPPDQNGPRGPASELLHRLRVRSARAVRPPGGRRAPGADQFLPPHPRRTIDPDRGHRSQYHHGPGHHRSPGRRGTAGIPDTAPESPTMGSGHRARIRLAEVLGQPREDRWIRQWGWMVQRDD